MLGKIRKEEKRLAAGFSYEPPTFYERNAAVTDRPEVPLAAPPRRWRSAAGRGRRPPHRERELVGV